MKSYVYILHFEQKLSHAQHYVGSTAALKQRLMAHANGGGSNICRVLMSEGIEWTLGALGECSHAAMRRLERSLKHQHNAKRYCGECNGEHKRIPDTLAYPVECVPFPIHSGALRVATNELWKPRNAVCRFTSAAEPPTTNRRIIDLMRKDKDALGFIPCGGPQGMALIFDAGLIVVCSNNGEDIGYLAFTCTHDRAICNIHQCAVADDARLLGHGKAMVDFVANKFPGMALCAKVRDDLAANEFWTALGFVMINTRTHKTSGSKINQYHREPLFQGSI